MANLCINFLSLNVRGIRDLAKRKSIISCQVHDESLEHLLVHCNFTQIFWSAVTTWLNEFNIGVG